MDARDFLDAAERIYPSFPENKRYVGVEPIDTGATSSVWKAFDKQLRLDVAIKVFDKHNRSIEEVLDEARASCAVRSDYVVRVTDVISDDPPSIVMELVGEHGLVGASAFHERPRSLTEAIRWVREAAQGVHAAHLRMISHRDLKPKNVLITPVSRRAMVTDFGLGIVRRRSDGSDSDGRCIAGTPTHMAPEQAYGIPIDMDMRRSLEDLQNLVAMDVFGLGALAFDLVTGNPPYVTDHAKDAHERALSCDRADLRKARTSWQRRVPRRLALIIEKALSTDPKMRHARAEDFEADLASWTNSRPTSIDRKYDLVRVGLWVRRNPQIVPIFLLVIVVIALVVLSIKVNSARDQLERIRHDIRIVEIDGRQKIESLQEAQKLLLDEMPALEEKRRSAIEQKDLAVQDLADAERRADREKVDKGRALRDRDAAFAARDQALKSKLTAEQHALAVEQRALAAEQRALAANQLALAAEERARRAAAEAGENKRQLQEASKEVQRLLSTLQQQPNAQQPNAQQPNAQQQNQQPTQQQQNQQPTQQQPNAQQQKQQPNAQQRNQQQPNPQQQVQQPH